MSDIEKALELCGWSAEEAHRIHVRCDYPGNSVDDLCVSDLAAKVVELEKDRDKMRRSRDEAVTMLRGIRHNLDQVLKAHDAAATAGGWQ